MTSDQQPLTEDAAVEEARTRIVVRSHGGALDLGLLVDRRLFEQYESAIRASRPPVEADEVKAWDCVMQAAGESVCKHGLGLAEALSAYTDIVRASRPPLDLVASGEERWETAKRVAVNDHPHDGCIHDHLANAFLLGMVEGEERASRPPLTDSPSVTVKEARSLVMRAIDGTVPNARADAHHIVDALIAAVRAESCPPLTDSESPSVVESRRQAVEEARRQLRWRIHGYGPGTNVAIEEVDDFEAAVRAPLEARIAELEGVLDGVGFCRKHAPTVSRGYSWCGVCAVELWKRRAEAAEKVVEAARGVAVDSGGDYLRDRAGVTLLAALAEYDALVRMNSSTGGEPPTPGVESRA